jgi:hypothetical protein
MSRPPLAGMALGFSPLMQAGGANTSRVERVPRMPPGARPEVVLAGRPTAQRTTDARAGSVAALVECRGVVDYRGSRAHNSKLGAKFCVNRHMHFGCSPPLSSFPLHLGGLGHVDIFWQCHREPKTNQRQTERTVQRVNRWKWPTRVAPLHWSNRCCRIEGSFRLRGRMYSAQAINMDSSATRLRTITVKPFCWMNCRFRKSIRCRDTVSREVPIICAISS